MWRVWRVIYRQVFFLLDMGVLRRFSGLGDPVWNWQQKLTENIVYFIDGLLSLGLVIGDTQSAIIPVKIGDAHKTSDAGTMLLNAGVYANAILYPAVAKRNSRILMGLMTTNTTEQLDKNAECL